MSLTYLSHRRSRMPETAFRAIRLPKLFLSPPRFPAVNRDTKSLLPARGHAMDNETSRMVLGNPDYWDGDELRSQRDLLAPEE